MKMILNISISIMIVWVLSEIEMNILEKGGHYANIVTLFFLTILLVKARINQSRVKN